LVIIEQRKHVLFYVLRDKWQGEIEGEDETKLI